MRVLLSLGGNTGDRLGYLRAALRALDALDGVTVMKVSSCYETEPVGVTDQPAFLNCAAEIETASEPLELLNAVKGIERQLGRTPSVRWGPRVIDIDIILCGPTMMRTDVVTLPHPEFRTRAFVLAPLAEIASAARDPVTGQSIAELASRPDAAGHITKLEIGRLAAGVQGLNRSAWSPTGTGTVASRFRRSDIACISAVSLKERKKAGDKIAVLTAYDYPSAKILDECGVDIVLVGDSCGNTIMGRPDTLSVTMDEMVHHTTMVARAVKNALVIGDMPFLSYQISPQEALRNAGRFIAEAGAQGVKLEGPADKFGETMTSILRAGIPVMGHIGLTPQSLNQIGGYKVQGRTPEGRTRLKQEAQGLEQIGCFAIVLECIPADLAAEITGMLSIPTIGIGAGAGCDGQVLVLHDILGWGTTKFCKTFGDVRGLMQQACKEYVSGVRDGTFPAKEHEFK